MNFSTKIVTENNKKIKKYFIDDKTVTEDVYKSMKLEQKERNKIVQFKQKDNCTETTTRCPRCTMINEVLDNILTAPNRKEQFDILNDFGDGVSDASFQNGHINTLRSVADLLIDIADKAEEEIDDMDE